MHYIVHTVSDGDLPEGVDWLTVEREDGPPVMLLAGTPARVWAAMRCWEDDSEPSLLLPSPRRPAEPSRVAS